MPSSNGVAAADNYLEVKKRHNSRVSRINTSLATTQISQLGSSSKKSTISSGGRHTSTSIQGRKTFSNITLKDNSGTRPWQK